MSHLPIISSIIAKEREEEIEDISIRNRLLFEKYLINAPLTDGQYSGRSFLQNLRQNIRVYFKNIKQI